MGATSTVADLTAGFASGAVSTLAVHPIDTVLTRFQARGAIGSAAILEARSMASSLGVLSLWRGAPALVGAAPFQNALLMAGYGAGRRWSSRGDDAGTSDRDEDRLAAVFVGGVIGGLLQCLVAGPAELLKVRRQVQDMMNSKRGIGGGGLSLTAGMGATMLRDGIPHGVWFASYEWCKHALSSAGRGRDGSPVRSADWQQEGHRQQRRESAAVPLLSGAFAASVAWAVGYPFDLIKTRIQAGAAEGVVEAAAVIVARGRRPDETSAAAVGRAAWNLYRGFGLKLSRAVPASAIGFVVYERALAFIEGLLAV